MRAIMVGDALCDPSLQSWQVPERPFVHPSVPRDVPGLIRHSCLRRARACGPANLQRRHVRDPLPLILGKLVI